MFESEKIQLVNEVNTLRKLKHPFIVSYHERIIDKVNQKIFLIMEFCENGDLRNLIESAKLKRFSFNISYFVLHANLHPLLL